MAKFGVSGFRQQRKVLIILGTAIVLAVPTPFVLGWIESLTPQPIKNYRGIPVAWRSLSTIKVRYKRVTMIPIKYVSSHRIPISYHDLSVIKVTYRNNGDSTSPDDPRFKMMRLHNTTFRVTPRRVAEDSP
jgi:hypothetical protein